MEKLTLLMDSDLLVLTSTRRNWRNWRMKYWRRRLLGEILRMPPDDMRRPEVLRLCAMVMWGLVDRDATLSTHARARPGSHAHTHPHAPARKASKTHRWGAAQDPCYAPFPPAYHQSSRLEINHMTRRGGEILASWC